ncbi:KleE stable inheritance protein [Aromatoleum anaerobium]|uniref:Protein kleE n=2 Tax=Aromatoleum TaxID=551759 RepID=A0ABX1PPF2_9RHOO|nr:KleE stable inheritance protein [Aromatoleum anaerobium]MCK0505335.1 protein kleE [Aromatoleum anaerobium]
MSNIVKFPGDGGPAPALPAPVQAKPKGGLNARGKVILATVWRAVWIVFVLVWPVLKWVISIEVFFQLIRMVYHWNTPGVHAGWTFLLHFGVLTALTYLVAFYKPKGL